VRSPSHRLLVAVSLAIALAACRPGSGDALAALEPCRIPGVEREVRCGTVTVAEDPDQPQGATIAVRFAVVPAVARDARPDPVFVLAGGPGQAATRTARQLMPVLSEVNTRRHVVFIDQRGTGGSHPLECDVDETTLAATFEQSQQLGRLNACLRSLAGDLRQYATWIAVRDFDAVRARLGADRVNLARARRSSTCGNSRSACAARCSTASLHPTWCCRCRSRPTPTPRWRRWSIRARATNAAGAAIPTSIAASPTCSRAPNAASTCASRIR
jgi:hypothetical protein